MRSEDIGKYVGFESKWREEEGCTGFQGDIWPRMPEPLRASEARALLRQIPFYRCQLYVLMVLCTGIRVHEALDLRLRDLNFDIRNITIRTKATTRNIPMPETLTRHLLPYIEMTFAKWESHEKLFGNMSCTIVPIVLKRASRACGIPFVVTNQVLRSTFVATALAAGIPWNEIAAILGWRPNSDRLDQMVQEFGITDDLESES